MKKVSSVILILAMDFARPTTSAADMRLRRKVSMYASSAALSLGRAQASPCARLRLSRAMAAVALTPGASDSFHHRSSRRCSGARTRSATWFAGTPVSTDRLG